MRQAFAHAIDKQQLIDGVVMGLGREATGPYKPDTWFYNGKVKRYPYDMARARQLLAEAGWVHKNGDGMLVKDGAIKVSDLCAGSLASACASAGIQ